MYCNCSLTRLWRYKFWNQPYFSDQVVFSAWPIIQKFKYHESEKAFKMKWKTFFNIFKGLSWNQIQKKLVFWNFPIIRERFIYLKNNSKYILTYLQDSNYKHVLHILNLFSILFFAFSFFKYTFFNW